MTNLCLAQRAITALVVAKTRPFRRISWNSLWIKIAIKVYVKLKLEAVIKSEIVLNACFHDSCSDRSRSWYFPGQKEGRRRCFHAYTKGLKDSLYVKANAIFKPVAEERQSKSLWLITPLVCRLTELGIH